MKKTTLLYLVLTASVFAACNNNTEKPLPKPGAEIVSATEPIKEDTLNKSTLTIKVVADSNVANGVYDINITYGTDTGQGKFTMPKGGEHLIPEMRKDKRPYTYIIGFHIPNDTTFYDYYEISSTPHGTNMRYLKAYTF